MIKRFNILLAFLWVICCGTHAGNPSDEESVVIPEIKNAIPDTLIGSTLHLSGSCNNILECQARRARNITDNINRMSKRLLSDAVQGIGAHSGKGPSGDISVRIIQGSGDYDYKAVVCYQNNPMIRVDWKKDNSKILVTRDLQYDALDSGESRQSITEVLYEELSGSTSLQIKNYGNWSNKDEDDIDGTYISESVLVRSFSDESLWINSVADWDTNPLPNDISNPDHYMVGRINEDDSGEFVAYRKEAPACSNGFDESRNDLFTPDFDGSDPRFCFGKDIDQSGVYNRPQLEAALLRLEPIGVHSKSNLRALSFDNELSCP